MDFPYGETEIAYLRARDLKLGAAMDRISPIHREVDPDLFSSVIHHIIGQQVSMAAQRTVWQRLQATKPWWSRWRTPLKWCIPPSTAPATN